MTTEAEQLVLDAMRKLSNSQRTDDARKFAAFEGLLNEISTALGDLVSVMERDGDDGAMKAMTEGLKALRIQAPTVNVNVSPTPVENHFEVTLPEMKVPPVQVILDERPRAKTLKIELIYDGPNGMPTGAIFTQLS